MLAKLLTILRTLRHVDDTPSSAYPDNDAESETSMNARVTRPDERGPGLKVILAGSLGTTLEFYDLLVYASVAALVFNKLFFPDSSPEAGALFSLSTFAIGYLARPLGAAIFGHLGDRLGRRQTLMLTMVMMGAATVLIGALPTYHQVGIWAPILLIALRLVQGAAVGGEWGGAVLLIGEHAGTSQRGRATSFAQLGSPGGLLLANAVVAVTVASMSEEQFLAWGWRMPFLFSALLFLVGLYIRFKVEETPVFEELKKQAAVAGSPVIDVFQKNWRSLTIAIGVTLVSFAGYGVFTTVGLAYLALNGAPSAWGLWGTVIGATAALPVVLVVGALSDRLGRKPFYWVSGTLMAAWSLAFFPLLQTHQAPIVMATVAFGISVWAILYGVQGAYLSELFPARVRYTGASLAYQITGAIGGLVPALALSLFTATGTPFAIAGVVLLGFVLSGVALVFGPETTRIPESELDGDIDLNTAKADA